MTALAAVFTRVPAAVEVPVAMVSTPALAVRGMERKKQWTAPHASIFVGRSGWEVDSDAAALIVTRNEVTVAADASLYYHDRLVDALTRAGVEPRSHSAGELILCAYQAWGTECPAHLEGDYAFIVWDDARQRAVLARDFVGRRPLFYRHFGAGNLIAASSSRAIANHPSVPGRIEPITIAASLGGLLGASNRTAFEDIVAVPAGATYVWTPSSELQRIRVWSAPVFAFGGKEDIPGAAAELRQLLVSATAERLAATSTAVWLSGGADSTAVYGAAQAGIQSAPESRSLHAVSVSYPAGDSAREDDFIAATCGMWNAPVVWIDSETVPLLEQLELRAGSRDDPYAHTFEQLNRTLARTTVATGARVTLDGYGGDQLFHVSGAFLADLALRLRFVVLARSLAELDVRDARSVIRWCLIPLLPQPVRVALARLRGREGLRASMEQTLPSWLRAPIASDARLRARASPEPARGLFEGPAAHESRWYLTSPYFPRGSGWAASFALQEGVEIRSPLMDERIVRFAASRPLMERAPLRGGKRVLRGAVAGLIPDSVLAPRPTKTGVPRGYFHRRMAEEFTPIFRETFAVPRLGCRLADLGLIEVGDLLAAHEQYLSSQDHLMGVNLYLTLQAEYWLRSQP